MATVTAIIPARNEEDHIEDCIISLHSQTKFIKEIIVVDGNSTDRTGTIARLHGAKVLHNYLKTKPYGFNMGCRVAEGDYILQMDAHSTISPSYVDLCLSTLERFPKSVVGGTTVSVPGSDTLIAKCISDIWTASFGRGAAKYRRSPTTYTEVDSMHSIMMPKEVIEKIGGYNTRLDHTHDLEFNARLRNRGYKLIQIPGIHTYYKARSTIWGLIKKAWSDGKWVIYPRKLTTVNCLTMRHFLPLLFVLTLPLSIWLHTVFNIYTAIQLARLYGLPHLFIMPILYLLYHTTYGLGSIYALLNLWRIK